MTAIPTQRILDLTACDLMTHAVLTIPQEMPLREAAGLLLRNQNAGAPVVDEQGRCVGVLSSTDFMRIASQREDAITPTSPPYPVNRPSPSPSTGPDGREVTGPALPPGVWPIQIEEPRPAGKEKFVASAQSSSFCTDWQFVDVEKLPAEEVRHYMTADPVTVLPGTSIRILARMIVDAHMHRVIVVDGEHRPMGIVTTGDIMGALADAEDCSELGRERRRRNGSPTAAHPTADGDGCWRTGNTTTSLRGGAFPHLFLRAETAADLMTSNPVSVNAGATVKEAVVMLTDRGFNAAPVIDEAGRPVGVLSSTDIVVHDRQMPAKPGCHREANAAANSQEDGLSRSSNEEVDLARVRDIMTPAVFSVTPETPARQVIEDMVGLKVHQLFVVDTDGILTGVISALDVLKYVRPEQPSAPDPAPTEPLSSPS
jgi:CBS domain-containing protein